MRALDASPLARPFRALPDAQLRAALNHALAAGDGFAGAHAIHERWMRGEISVNVERDLAALWAKAASSIPDWLPMRYVERLADIYEIASRFEAAAGGKSNISCTSAMSWTWLPRSRILTPFLVAITGSPSK